MIFIIILISLYDRKGWSNNKYISSDLMDFYNVVLKEVFCFLIELKIFESGVFFRFIK